MSMMHILIRVPHFARSFAQNWKKIHSILSTDVANKCAVSLILFRLDYCNSLFAGISDNKLNKLQRTQNHTARFVLRKSYSLVGLVVRRPPRERKVLASNPACAGIFSGSSHTCDLNIGTPVATLPGAWRYRVSTGTGRPGVSIL